MTMSPVIGPSQPVQKPKAEQSSIATTLVTTPVPAHTELPAEQTVEEPTSEPQPQAQPEPQLAPQPQVPASRKLVTNAPATSMARPVPSAPKTQTGSSMQSTSSGSNKGAMITIGVLVVMLAIGIGVLMKVQDGKANANTVAEETVDEDPGKTSPPVKPASLSEEPQVQPVTSVKPEPRPFVPLTPEPVEPRPASSGEVAKPTSVKLAKKLPEVAPDIRPDESQITILSVDDTEGLASKVNTWVRLSGEVVTTSVDGQWAFAGDEPVVAQLRNGQFEIVSNKSVEILGWLADEKEDVDESSQSD